MSVNFNSVEITSAHVDVLAQMHGEAFTHGWDTSALMSALSQPGAFGFIVTIGDEPLGFALLRAATFQDGGGEAEVLTIATRPSAHRKGVARTAMKAATARLTSLGVERVFLEVAEDNVAARGLYESLGFEDVGRRKAYYERGIYPRMDAIIMALDFKP